LFADFDSLAGELFSIAGVVEFARFLKAGEDNLGQEFGVSSTEELGFHFVYGVGTAHEDAKSVVVEVLLGVEFVSPGKHGRRVKERCNEVKGRNDCGFRRCRSRAYGASRLSKARIAEIITGVAAYFSGEQALYFPHSEPLGAEWRETLEPFLQGNLGQNKNRRIGGSANTAAVLCRSARDDWREIS